MRSYSEPVSAELREKLIVGAAAAVTGIYRYFEAQRLVEEPSPGNATTFRRTMPKIGRNDPCPCGSGRNFKLLRQDRIALSAMNGAFAGLPFLKEGPRDQIRQKTRCASFSGKSQRLANPCRSAASSVLRRSWH